MQHYGYLVGKGLAIADPDSQAAACLSMFSTYMTENFTPDKATAFTAGLAGLPPPNADFGIDSDAIGPFVVRRLRGIPIAEQDGGSDVADLLLGAWEMVALKWSLDDKTDNLPVQPGGYVIHFGDDDVFTIGMLNDDGDMATTEGPWSYDSATGVVTMIIEGEVAPMPLVSVTRDRLVFRTFDEDTQIMQTMVFARTGG